MRTHILITAALVLATTTAHAAPRSLSGAQTNPIEPPHYTVQAVDQAKPADQPQAAEQPAATETKPVQAAPVEQKPAAAPAVEAKPVEAKPAPEGKPVKQAQRRQKHRQASVEQHIQREFRNVERTVGFALSSIPLVIPFYW